MRETYQPPTTSPSVPPHDHTLEETALLPPSTQSDRIRQNPTETRVRAFLYSRARARGNGVRFPLSA